MAQKKPRFGNAKRTQKMQISAVLLAGHNLGWGRVGLTDWSGQVAKCGLFPFISVGLTVVAKIWSVFPLMYCTCYSTVMIQRMFFLLFFLLFLPRKRTLLLLQMLPWTVISGFFSIFFSKPCESNWTKKRGLKDFFTATHFSPSFPFWGGRRRRGRNCFRPLGWRNLNLLLLLLLLLLPVTVRTCGLLDHLLTVC